MQPIHSIEYELTTELATQVQKTLVPWESRRGWKRDLPLYAGAAVFSALIIALGMQGWILPGVGGGLICLIALFAIGAALRRRAVARGTAYMALLALQTSDRRVRIDLGDDRLRMETEFFRGEGAWSELEEVLIFPSYWLLQLSSGGQILIPTSAMKPEMETFIRTKAAAAMATVASVV